MRFNEWVILIKRLRDWCINKCQLIDYYLIEKYDDDDDDNDDDNSINKARAINLLWYINKCWLINYYLIEKYNNNDNNDDLINKIKVINLL